MSRREFPKEYMRDELLISSPFWKEALAAVSRPAALQLIARLSPHYPCGIDPEEHGIKLGGVRGEETPVDTLLISKQTRPNMLHLLRVGEFFEFGHGIDSVIACEYTGLRPMGNGIPRVGTPIANLQPTADALTRAGFSVVVFEQMDVPGKKTKGRFVSQILTPSSPVYTYNLLLDSSRDAAFPEVPPVFGLAQGLRGITLVEVLPDLEMVCLTDALTWEAARARLERFGAQAGKIYMHDSLGVASFLHQMVLAPGASPGGERGHQLSELIGKNFTSIEKVSGVRADDFPRSVENLVKLELNLPAEPRFKLVSKSSAEGQGRPRPLYLGTATQIGLLPMRGVPDLVEQMLPRNSPNICRGLLKDLLLTPPPPAVAAAIRSITSRLISSDESLPDFRVSAPARYIRTVHAREASASILRDLHRVTSDFLAADAGALGSVMEYSLRVVSHFASLSLDRARVREGAAHITSLISSAVSFGQPDPCYKPTHPLLPGELFSSMERDFRGHLVNSSDAELEAAYQAVNEAAWRYESALCEDFQLNTLPLPPPNSQEVTSDLALETPEEAPLSLDSMPQVDNGKKKKAAKKSKSAAVVYDFHDDAIWLKEKPSAGASSAAVTAGAFISPRDRFGKIRSDRYSTERVERELAAYKRSCQEAKSAVEKVLRRVSEELSPLVPEILLIVTYGNLMKTLISHLTEVLPKGWSNNVEITDEKIIEVEGLFPYWMRREAAVVNSLSLTSMALLTGPNMAGKSTLLRTMSVCLLSGAAAGLLIPAARLKTGQVASITARISAQDDSESGVSSFGIECLDIKAVLRDAQPSLTAELETAGGGGHSSKTNQQGINWVAVDELGKGTDSRAGSALAGAVLEELYKRGIMGVFATHWWELWQLPVKLQEIPSFHMEVEGGSTTHRVLPGSEFTSLAFDVAEKLGLPQEVIARAREIASHYRAGGAGEVQREENPLASEKAPSPLSEQTSEEDSAIQENSEPSVLYARRLLAAAAEVSLEELRLVAPQRTPPIKDLGKSCLYILRTEGGFYYVGETDNIARRLSEHRQDKKKSRCEAFYTPIAQGKSQARKLESELIATLVNAGFPMLSSSDMNHKHFGGQ